MMRRGQTALEFLTTYGWGAFLIIMALLVMTYFSVINPQMLIPEMCIFPESNGISCSVKDASTDGSLTLKLTNTHAESVIVDAACIYDDKSVRIITKNILIDGEPLASQLWPQHSSRLLTCQFDGDNPFAGRANEKSEVFAEISVEREGGIYSFIAPVRVLVEASS